MDFESITNLFLTFNFDVSGVIFRAFHIYVAIQEMNNDPLIDWRKIVTDFLRVNDIYVQNVYFCVGYVHAYTVALNHVTHRVSFQISDRIENAGCYHCYYRRCLPYNSLHLASGASY